MTTENRISNMCARFIKFCVLSHCLVRLPCGLYVFNLHILVLVSSSNIGPSRQGQFGVIKDEHIAVKSCSSLEEGSFIHDPCFNDSWIYDLVIDPPLAANTVCRYILDNNIHITSLIYFLLVVEGQSRVESNEKVSFIFYVSCCFEEIVVLLKVYL